MGVTKRKYDKEGLMVAIGSWRGAQDRRCGNCQPTVTYTESQRISLRKIPAKYLPPRRTHERTSRYLYACQSQYVTILHRSVYPGPFNTKPIGPPS